MNPPASLGRIGLMSPGDMGSAVAVRLKELGFDVCSALAGRSERTRKLAALAGVTDCGDLRTLLASTDLVLSILDPGSAMPLAREIATLMPSLASRPLFADCNALAPQTKQAMQALFEESGARFVDAGIIGPPPRGNGRIHLYVSGAYARAMNALQHDTIDVRFVSERVGDAAAVKMCYGAITKGTTMLLTELLVAARRLGVEDMLDKELVETQPVIRKWILDHLPSMPPKAYRWVPETEEIAATFEAEGLTPLMMQGAARMCEAIAVTAAGKESPEEGRARGRKGVEVVAALDADFPAKPRES